MQGIWKTWITLWCAGVILFGVVLAAAGLPATDGIARALYGLLGQVPAGADLFVPQGARFSVAIMGAVSIGWGLTILFLLPAVQAAGAPAWRGLTAAVLVWFVIDSGLSLATGFALNALSNTALVFLYMAPVIASGALKVR